MKRGHAELGYFLTVTNVTCERPSGFPKYAPCSSQKYICSSDLDLQTHLATYLLSVIIHHEQALDWAGQRPTELILPMDSKPGV